MQDLERVAQVDEKRSFRDFVTLLGSITPNLRRVTTYVESSWPMAPAEARTRVLEVMNSIEELRQHGARRRHPKNVFDRLWLSFSDDIRVATWEFADAAGRFSAAVSHALAAEEATRTANTWAEVKRTDPAFAALHERSVAAIEAGARPIVIDWEKSRPTST
jgi:hypothetical protein